MLVYQKHTQFASDPAHVVGRRFWPDYALRTFAAFALTVVGHLGCSSLLEINPIERYGPYSDWTVPNPAVPDWYAAFLDGALRLGPAWEPRVAGHPIPAIFWPGVVMPLVVFAVVVAWPWIDARFTRDRAKHDVLVAPSTRAVAHGRRRGARLCRRRLDARGRATTSKPSRFTFPLKGSPTFTACCSRRRGSSADAWRRCSRAISGRAARCTGARRSGVVELRRTAEGGFAEQTPQTG